jgi:glycosyltransferase involved in cell wall biosynthesis
MLVPDLIRRKSRWVKTAWITLMDRANIEGAAAIHTTSDVEAGHLKEFGWRLPHVRTIPHGVDDPPILADQAVSDDVAAIIKASPFVLALGRISWEKGLDRLLEALPKMPSARLVIAGGDADGHAAFLADKARKLQVAGRVTILARHVDGADKEALFAAACVFAMTSLSENFGLAAFEAMRRGLPVLATPDVGMSEIVREVGAGAVVDPRPDAIAAGIRGLLADEATRQAMGEQGRAHVVAHYSWSSVAQRMEELYRSVLDEQPGRPRAAS